MNEWIISTDIAKAYDRTTVAIFQKCNEFLADGRCISYIIARDLKQWEQMPYTELGRVMCRLDSNTALHHNNDLLVDSTGVGEAVCDVFEEAGLQPKRIIFTGGESSKIRTSSKSFGDFNPRRTINVPKAELIDTLKLGLEQRRVRTAQGIAFEDDIKKQFSHFVEMLTRTKKVTYGNDSPTVHDDIVCAYAMATWFFFQEDGALKDFVYDTERSYKTLSQSRYLKGATESADYDAEKTI